MKAVEKTREEIIRAVSEFDVKNKRVLVKPNLVSLEKYPTTTDPEVLDSVIEALRGCDIMVADGPSTDYIFLMTNGALSWGKLAAEGETVDEEKLKEKYGWIEKFAEYRVNDGLPNALDKKILQHFKEVIEKSELSKVCKKYDIPIRSFNENFGYRKVEFNNVEIRVVDLKDFDAMINLPVLKLHSHCSYGGARKNLYGLVHYFDKLVLHHKTEAERNFNFLNFLCELPSLLNTQILTVLDTTKIQSCQHQGAKKDVKIYEGNGLVIGINPREVDKHAYEILKRVVKEGGTFMQDFMYRDLKSPEYLFF